MTLYVILYHHKHGLDTCLMVDEAEGTAVSRLRASMVAMYSEEEIAGEEEEYGGLEVVLRIPSGESLRTFNGERYRATLSKEA